MAQHARQLAALLLRPTIASGATAATPTSLPVMGLSARALSSLTSAKPHHSSRTEPSASGNWPLIGALAAVAGLTSAAYADVAPLAPPAAPKSGSSDTDYMRPVPKGLPQQITLYQYEVCPFCCKVKAALDYYKVPYDVVEVNPLTKGELKWSEYKKVPVVKVDEEVLTGSSAIMSRVAAEAEAAAAAASSTSSTAPTGRLSAKAKAEAAAAAAAAATAAAAALEVETKWRKWVDDWFVKLLTANIYRSWDESWDTFRYITEQTNWSWGTREVARVSGAALMWQVGKRMPKKYGIEGDLREVLYTACNEFVDAVGPNRPFLGGDKPNLADLAVFGVLRAVRDTPTFRDAMAHSPIGAWYGRVEAAVGPSSRVSTGGSSWSLAPKEAQ